MIIYTYIVKHLYQFSQYSVKITANTNCQRTYMQWWDDKEGEEVEEKEEEEVDEVE